MNSHLDYEKLLDVRRKTIVLGILFLLILGSVVLWLGESYSGSRTRVFLIGIDGASWDILRKLASENKIPNLRKLMERGASGYLDSINWRKKVDKGYGLFSPNHLVFNCYWKTSIKTWQEDFSFQFRRPKFSDGDMTQARSGSVNPCLSFFPKRSHDSSFNCTSSARTSAIQG